MLRIVLFLVLIALAGLGAAWIADQPGKVILIWGDWQATPSIPRFVLAIGVIVVAAIIGWTILSAIWRMPARVRRHRHEKRHARGRHAITHGLLAIGHGDAEAARWHSEAARRYAPNDPLALLLHAQSAQLEGNREQAQLAFRAMAERADTRLLGLRGLFIEAQRADDVTAAAMIAEEAVRLSPSSTWASQAVLGFRCAKSDWTGALAILDSNLSSGLISKKTYRRERGVLLTARALELETRDRDVARASVMEAVKLAPTLVPAAVLAAKFASEAHQVRRAMKTVEAAWVAHPHPDLADAYAHVRLGDSALERLRRVETLAAKTPGHIEGVLAIARAAIDASEFARARAVLEPFIEDPTQRLALLMAELERSEHGDSGRARAWTLRAVRARHDPAWTADGYVSDRWRPVSPVTGRLDAFKWQTPVASLPSDKNFTIESSSFEETHLKEARLVEEARLASPPKQVTGGDNEPTNSPLNSAMMTSEAESRPMQEVVQKPVQEAVEAPVERPVKTAEPASVAQVGVPLATEAPSVAETPPAAEATKADPAALPESMPEAAGSSSMADTPLFRTRTELGKPKPAPPVIPLVRPPDDPGIDDEGPADEFAEQIGTPKAQPGGWHGFWSRWG